MDLILKYKFLNKSAKQEVNDFIDLLFSKPGVTKETTLSAHRRKIVSDSLLSKPGLSIFAKNFQLPRLPI